MHRLLGQQEQDRGAYVAAGGAASAAAAPTGTVSRTVAVGPARTVLAGVEQVVGVVHAVPGTAGGVHALHGEASISIYDSNDITLVS